MTIESQKKVEFSFEMTQQEFVDFVHACDKLITLPLKDEESLRAIAAIQGIKNSMLLALND